MYLSFYIYFSISHPGRLLHKTLGYCVAVIAFIFVAHPNPLLIIKDPMDQLLNPRVNAFLLITASPIFMGIILHNMSERMSRFDECQNDALSSKNISQSALHNELQMILDLNPQKGPGLIDSIKSYLDVQLGETDEPEEKAKIRKIIDNL